MDTHELTQDELQDEQANLLPEREAMSLIATDPGSYPIPDTTMPPLADTGAGPGGPPPDGDLPPIENDVDPQETTGGSDAPRSEVITQSDTATAES